MSFKKKLEEWGLAQYIEVFQDEGINDDCFHLIDEETIRKIFTKTGHRLLFQHNFSKSEQSQECVTKDNVDYGVQEQALDGSLPSTMTMTSDLSLELNSEVNSSVNSIDSGENYSYSYEPDNETLKIIESLRSIENTTFLKPQSPKKRPLEVATEVAPEASTSKKRLAIDSVFPEGLESTLKKYTDGQIALANRYKLSGDCRQKIVKVIINELIASCGLEVRASTFLRISEEVENVFPNEKAETYYIPYVAGLKNKRGTGPRGKLWSRYVNVKKALRSANKLPGERIEKKNSPGKELTAIEAAYMSFLKVATEPYAKVVEAWEETFKIRRRIYLNSDLSTIFQDFPCLKMDSGIELIENDFNKKFETQMDMIYAEWPKLADAIIKEVNERNINIGTSLFKDATLHALLTLPYLFSPTTIKTSRKGGIWRPTRSEMQESFVLHISSYDELHERLTKRKQKLCECGLTLQPTACVVGELENPSGYYIVIDEATYKVKSSIRMLELLFKAFHALDLEYPAECEGIWLLIQKMVYNIKTVTKNAGAAAVESDLKYHLAQTE